MARSPEQGHTPKCLAHAMICAIENARDSAYEDARGNADMAQFTFRVLMQENVGLVWADSYLSDGTVTCLCED